MNPRELLSGRLLWALGLITIFTSSCQDQTPAFKEVAEFGGEEAALDHTSDADATPRTDGTSGNGAGGAGGSRGDDDGVNTGSGPGSGGGSSGTVIVDSIERVFSATSSDTGRLVYDWNTDRLEQYLTMEHRRNEESITLEQAVRPQHTEIFSQGSDERANTENFSQSNTPSGVLDILVVVDNSPSMREEQTNLSTKMQPLLSYVQQSDWRIGVVTTDPQDGCLRALISKGDANADTAFRNAINAGVRGTGNEQGIYQAVQALKGTCNGGSWLRANSTVAVLIVSDEDNCSDGRGCGSNAWGQGSYLTNYLNSIRQPGVNARVYGLIWHPSMTTNQCSTAINRGYIYGDVISSTGGSYGAICDADYTATLSSISQNLSVILQSQFSLAYAPIAGSVVVKVNGVVQTSGWRITGNVLSFDPAPPAGAAIEVAYQYFLEAPTTTFTLARAADSDTLEVMLDGQPVARTEYEYNAATKSLNFYRAPVGRSIKATYREESGLRTDFAIGAPVDARTVSVYVNDQQAMGAEYTILGDQGIVRFFDAPRDGARVQIYYIRSGSPRLDYPIFLPATALSSLEVYDEATLDDVPFTISGNFIEFANGEFASGRNLVLSYRSNKAQNRVIDVGHDVSSVMDISSERATMCDPFVVGVSGTVIDLNACSFREGDRVHIRFAFVTQHQTSFVVDDPRIGDGQGTVWNVFVDGVIASDWTRQGNVVTIPNLPLNARVTIRVGLTR